MYIILSRSTKIAYTYYYLSVYTKQAKVHIKGELTSKI